LIVENIKVFVDIVKKESSYIKSKFGSWVDRVSLQEIRVEWREVVENFFLVILSIFLYSSVLFTQFTFVPIMLITIKRGWKEAALYVTLSSAVLLYAMLNAHYWFPFDNSILLFSPTHFAFHFIGDLLGVKGIRFLDYFFIFGMLGLFLGSLVSQNYKLKYVVFFGICVYIGITIFVLSLASLLGSFDSLVLSYSQFVEKKTNSYVNLYLSQMDNLRDVFKMHGIDYGFFTRKVEIAAEVFKRSVLFEAAPKGGYLLKQIVVIFLGLIFVKLYFKGRLKRAALHFDIRRFRIADDWVWALIISWGLVYINLFVRNNLLALISWNAAVAISFFFFLKGLKLLKIVADRLKIPPFIEYVVFLFLLFYLFILFVTIVTGIGVADIWLKITDSITQKRERRDR